MEPQGPAPSVRGDAAVNGILLSMLQKWLGHTLRRPYRSNARVSDRASKRGRSNLRRSQDRDASLRDRALVGPGGPPRAPTPALPAAYAPLPVSCGAGRAAAAWSVRGPGLGPAGDGRWRSPRHRRRSTGRGGSDKPNATLRRARGQAALGVSPLRDERRSVGEVPPGKRPKHRLLVLRAGRGPIEPDRPASRGCVCFAHQRQIRFPPLRGGPSAFAVAPVRPARPVLAVRPTDG